jgi:hypothetical protein
VPMWVMAWSHAQDRAVMPAYGPHFRARPRFDDLHPARAGTPGQLAAVGAEGQAQDVPGIQVVRAQFGAPWGRVPHFHGTLVAGGGQQLAVGTERDAADGRRPGQGAEALARGRVPEPHGLAQPAARGDV